MPNRVLREGILTSERVAQLGWAAETFYRRLMSVVDDFGRYYANPMLLRAACYPLQLDKVSDSDIGKWLAVCAEAGLVRVYPAEDGKRYLQLLDFRQQVRAEKSKFPELQGECVADAAHVLRRGQSVAHLDVDVDVDVIKPLAGKPAVAKFEDFYAVYPRKVKPVDARKAWDKLKPDAALLARMLKAIDEQKKSPQWLKDGGQFIPYPATWLNAGEWENQTVVEVATAKEVEVWKPPPPMTEAEKLASEAARQKAMSAIKRMHA